MPRKRKTQDMSPPTILRWLKIYLVEAVRMTKSGELYPDEGKRVVKGLRYSIKGLEDSYAHFKADQRAIDKTEYEEALAAAENL